MDVLKQKIEFLRQRLIVVPDFPAKGVQYQDITSLLRDPVTFRTTVDAMYWKATGELLNTDLLLGIESRGFILAAALARTMSKGLVLARKPGKLPRSILTQSYQLEYGEASLQVHTEDISPSAKVLIVDDVLATGGTAHAAVRLVEYLGGKVLAVLCLIEIPDLGGRAVLEEAGVTVHSVL